MKEREKSFWIITNPIYWLYLVIYAMFYLIHRILQYFLITEFFIALFFNIRLKYFYDKREIDFVKYCCETELENKSASKFQLYNLRTVLNKINRFEEKNKK